MSSSRQAISLTPLTPGGSTSSRVPQTSIQLASGSQAPGGQQSQSRPNRYTPSRAQQSSQTLRPPTSGVPPVPAPAQQHQSIFHFRSERANWIAVIAIVITLVLGTVAAVYSAVGVRLAEDSKRLAVWEAEKDYQIYCQNLKAAHQRLSDECARIVDAVLSPPPFHDPGFFVRFLTGIRRSITRLPSASALGSFMSSTLWLTIACGVVTGLGYILYRAGKWPQTQNDLSLTDQLKTCMSIVLLLVLRVLRPHFGNVEVPSVRAIGISDPGRAVFVLLWVACHFWVFHRTMILFPVQGHYTWRQIQMSLGIWSMLGAFPSFLMACDQPWYLLLLLFLDLPVSVLFINPRFPAYDWDDTCTAIGPSWGVRLWSLGHYLNAILGILVLGHLTLGGDRGALIIAMDKVMQKSLHVGRRLLAACMLLYFIAFLIDNFVHKMRHRRSGTRCSN